MTAERCAFPGCLHPEADSFVHRCHHSKELACACEGRRNLEVCHLFAVAPPAPPPSPDGPDAQGLDEINGRISLLIQPTFPYDKELVARWALDAFYAQRALLTERAGLLAENAKLREALDNACILGKYCNRHEFVHGAEAEELRQRLEVFVKDADASVSRRAIEYLDRIDARDSLAYLEAAEALKGAR